MNKIPKMLYLSKRQVELLTKEAKSKDLAFSELIRRILDKHIDKND